jgi:hypothetical protein
MNFRRISKFLGGAFLCASLTTQAADRQTHFYGDLIMGLSADLNAYDVIQYAFGDEMVDGGLYTHPMGLDAARILSHFQGNPITIKTDGGFMKEGLAIATIDHPLLYKLLDEGMKTGNKAMIGAVRHRLIDTFFHAGWSNFWGHMEGGHRPDMPQEEVYKSQRCFQAIMELTFYLRDMSDGPVKTTQMENILSRLTQRKLGALYQISKTNNVNDLAQYMRSKPGLYAEVLWSLPELKNAYMVRIENSNAYQDLAFESLFTAMKASGYVSLDAKEYAGIKGFFTDLHDRNDLTVQDAFRLAMNRMFQTLTNTQADESANLKLPDSIKAKLHLEKLVGLNSIEALNAKVNLSATTNAGQLRLLVAEIEDLKEELGGKWKPSSQFSLTEKASLDSVAGKVISWIQVLDPNTGSPNNVNDPRMGDIPDLRDSEGFISLIFNRQPEFLDNFVSSVTGKNDSQLAYVARLKAIAELANLASIEATKDIIPNARNTSTQRVNFENDGLPHACFANGCRELAARNAIAKLFGVDAQLGHLGTLGLTEFLAEKIKEIKLKMNKTARTESEAQKARMDKLMAEHLVEVGFAQKMADGSIATEIELNPELVKINPKMTFKGVWTWFKWSRNEMAGLMYRMDTKFKKFRSLEIENRIEIGQEIKDRIVLTLNQKYGTGETVPSNKTLAYPTIKSGKSALTEQGQFKITGKGNAVNYSGRCEELGVQFLAW